MTTINPYLNFDGNCEEVFNFYKSVFGGEFVTVMRFKEMPAEAMDDSHQMMESEGEKIMHVSLPIGAETVLMGSDRPAAMGPTTTGNNFFISIDTESQEEAARLFEGLSAGGQVTMPLDKAFWGGYFGMFTDKFGVQKAHAVLMDQVAGIGDAAVRRSFLENVAAHRDILAAWQAHQAGQEQGSKSRFY